jgi:hypothetical protein
VIESVPEAIKVEMGTSTDPWLQTGRHTTELAVQTESLNEGEVIDIINQTEAVLNSDLRVLAIQLEARSKKSNRKMKRKKEELEQSKRALEALTETFKTGIQEMDKVRHDLPEVLERHTVDNQRLTVTAKQVPESLQRMEREHEQSTRTAEQRRYMFEMHWEAKIRTALNQLLEIQKERAVLGGDMSKVEELEKALAVSDF